MRIGEVGVGEIGVGEMGPNHLRLFTGDKNGGDK